MFGGGASTLVTQRQRFVRKSELMIEPASMVLRVSEAKRMFNRAGDVERLPTNLEGFLRIAQMPQRQSEVATVGYSRVLSHPRCPGAR